LTDEQYLLLSIILSCGNCRASFFEKAGEVIDVRLPRSEHDRPRMFCHVDFAAEEAVKKVI
jgi:RNA recognition motif. (a.k.a. RRM, RBD, or RNP domain)